MLFYFLMLVGVYILIMCVITAVTRKDDKPVHPREDRPPPTTIPPPTKNQKCNCPSCLYNRGGRAMYKIHRRRV